MPETELIASEKKRKFLFLDIFSVSLSTNTVQFMTHSINGLQS